MSLTTLRRRAACWPRRLAFWALACAASIAIAAPAPATPTATAPAVLTLDRAVATAVARSQSVAAAAAQARAAGELAVAADRRPDPVLKLGLVNVPADGPDRYSTTRDFMTMRSVAVMQELTGSDKRRARAERAQREVELAQVGRQALVADVQRDAALAWLERSLQGSMRDLVQAQVEQAALQAEAAEATYRSGKGAQTAVFAARAEVERWRDRLDETERQLAVAATQLARWVGDDAPAALGARPPLELPAWTAGDLAAHLAAHPLIATAQQQEAVAESEAALARAEKRADWSVELMFSQRGQAYTNMLSLNLSVPLQWDQAQRQDRELAARLAGVDEARARREDLQRMHEAEVLALLHEWRSHAARLRRYDETLLPLADQRSASALVEYRAGSGALAAVIEARRGELDLHMERLRIEMDRARVWVRLNYLQPAADAGGATGAVR